MGLHALFVEKDSSLLVDIISLTGNFVLLPVLKVLQRETLLPRKQNAMSRRILSCIVRV